MSGDTDFSDWIGKSETEHGVALAYAANYFTLTLDRDDPAFADGDALPPAWHYFYFHELVALAATGEDGHRAKGDFMPPLPFPRRMWAGSKMNFQSPIRIGEQVKKVITIADIAIYPWLRGWKWSKVDITDRPNVMAWIDRVRERPGVARGLAYGVPEDEIDRWSQKRRESYAKGGSSIASNDRLRSDL